MSHPANKYILPFLLLSVAGLFLGLNWDANHYSPKIGLSWKRLSASLLPLYRSSPSEIEPSPKAKANDLGIENETEPKSHWYLYALSASGSSEILADLGEYNNKNDWNKPQIAIDSHHLYYHRSNFDVVSLSLNDPNKSEVVGNLYFDGEANFINAIKFPSISDSTFLIDGDYLNGLQTLSTKKEGQYRFLASLQPSIYSKLHIESYLENSSEIIVWSQGGDGGGGTSKIWKVKKDGTQVRKLWDKDENMAEARQPLIGFDSHFAYFADYRLASELNPKPKDVERVYLAGVIRMNLISEEMEPFISNLDPKTAWIQLFPDSHIIRTDKSVFSSLTGLELLESEKETIVKIYGINYLAVQFENQTYFTYLGSGKDDGSFTQVNKKTGGKTKTPIPFAEKLEWWGMLEDGRILFTSTEKFSN